MEKKKQIEIATIAKQLCFNSDEDREFLKNKSEKQLIEAFIIEKNAKNKAYYFILENGHLDAFRAYCNKKQEAMN